MIGSKNKLTVAGVILVTVILGQACRASNSPGTKAADRSNSNATVAAAPLPPPGTDSQCDPNYSPCVPIASDVDCFGGKGNGPAYVKGPVRVIGKDIYKLDRDHNGIGCE